MQKVYKNPESLLAGLADFIVTKSAGAIRKEGRFNFVLSGGSSPKKLYELLTSNDYKNKIEWKNVYFFLVMNVMFHTIMPTVIFSWQKNHCLIR